MKFGSKINICGHELIVTEIYIPFHRNNKQLHYYFIKTLFFIIWIYIYKLTLDCTSNMTKIYVYFKLFIAVYFNEIRPTLPEDDNNTETCWSYVIEKYIVCRIVQLFCYQSSNIYKCTQ
jgi:hypothetical protein